MSIEESLKHIRNGYIAAIISAIMARIFIGICIRLLPFYARRQASKGRFLIRFSNPIADMTMTRKRKARIALSHAWVPFAFCVFIASSAITFQGFEGAATGEGLEFYKCADGEEIMAIGDQVINRAVCEELFGTSNFNDISLKYSATKLLVLMNNSKGKTTSISSFANFRKILL